MLYTRYILYWYQLTITDAAFTVTPHALSSILPIECCMYTQITCIILYQPVHVTLMHYGVFDIQRSFSRRPYSADVFQSFYKILRIIEKRQL